jgi:phage repressor protein C with HTH and peptisase S24 domain
MVEGRMGVLASLNRDYPVRSFRPGEIAWIARILWASQ